MVNIVTILSFLESFIGSAPFLLTVMTIAFLVKGYLLAILVIRGSKSTTTKKYWFYLSGVFISAMIADSAWILALVKSLYFQSMNFNIYLFWLRIAWAFTIVLYQSLALFIESLIKKQDQSLNLRQKIFIFISGSFFLFYMVLAFLNFNCSTPTDRPAIEFTLRNIQSLYALFPLMLTSLFITLQKLRSMELPRILKQQLKILIQMVILPLWFSDFLQIFPLVFSPIWQTNSYMATALSTILLTYALYYCSKKVIVLRFLNFKGHVQAEAQYNFIDNFKGILERLSHATNIHELGILTQNYFKDAFDITSRQIALYIRKADSSDKELSAHEFGPIQKHVEALLHAPAQDMLSLVHQSKILIHDEIAFSNFYEKNNSTNAIVRFLETINADIFLPIYENQTIIAYIIVDRNARPRRFYSDMERDEMLVFASYLGNIIHLLQNRNLESLIHHEKELKEELYNKHQEINQYKESIRSFLRDTKQKEIGIIFYKSRRFVFGNQAAKELVKININTQEGHPLSQALRKIARTVEEYKSPQTCFAKDHGGNTLVLAGVPNLEHNNVIIMVYYPEVSDILKKQIDVLKNPTHWDYLLYLETTKTGQLINQLIPGSGETLVNFKIHLLKTALSKKATLLDMPEEDLGPTVELLHHISLRETLHVLTLEGPEKNFDTAIKLFGISSIYGIPSQGEPLLKKLDGIGTLFIKNFNFLGLETQEYLAEYLRYGVFRIFKSDQKISSSVRIICSTSYDINTLLHEGKISKELAQELKKTSLVLPSLHTLPEQELSELAEGFSEQALQTQTFKNILELSDKDKYKLAHQRPVSLQELKTKVQHILVTKSKKNEIFHETQFDPAYEVTDPDLVQAARLGKHALRDQKIMAMLWHKFKNQNQIASFLNVNRSSVNRRCKEYNLE